MKNWGERLLNEIVEVRVPTHSALQTPIEWNPPPAGPLFRGAEGLPQLSDSLSNVRRLWKPLAGTVQQTPTSALLTSIGLANGLGCLRQRPKTPDRVVCPSLLTLEEKQIIR